MPSTMSVISSRSSHEVIEGLPFGINGDLDNLDGRCRPMGVTVLLRHLQARHQVRIADRRCDRELLGSTGRTGHNAMGAYGRAGSKRGRHALIAVCARGLNVP